MHMYTPKVEKLWEPGVWLDAATQVFYSFGLAFGSLIAFGSYNTPKNNCVRDVFLVSVCNAVTGKCPYIFLTEKKVDVNPYFSAIYASVVIFAILGFKATVNVKHCFQTNKQILFDANMSRILQIEDDHAMHLVHKLNKTVAEEMGLNWECSLETMLSNVSLKIFSKFKFL